MSSELSCDQLKCPRCEVDFDPKEFISELGIFITPMHIKCICNTELTIRAEIKDIRWHLNEVENCS